MKNLEKQQVFVNNQYEYDYQLTINDDGNEIHTLTYADVDSWDNSVKNTVAMEIEDYKLDSIYEVTIYSEDGDEIKPDKELVDAVDVSLV